MTCSSCGHNFRLDLQGTPTWSPRELPRLGSLELLEAVGQGAFGAVYRARDTALDRIVAVKVPRGGQWLTPADVDRFAREARSVAQLNHPGIVPVYEVGKGAAVPYIVSAFVQGVTLAQALAERRYGFREAAELAAEVADALDHAHQHGVVHRDLKPSNIMLGSIAGKSAETAEPGKVSPQNGADLAAQPHSPAGRAFVMDFGLARRDEGEVTVTVEGQILGTPAYMSPEQARGEAHGVDGRSDLYSLGVILYEMQTGELPFRGVARMVLQQILADEPRAPRSLNDKIPRDLETITLKCLAKEPSRRYGTAGQLAADLRRYLAGEPIQARPVGRVERYWRWAKRNPRVAGLSAAVVVLLVIVAIVSVVSAIQISHEAHAAVHARDVADQARDVADQRDLLTTETLDTFVNQIQEELRDKPDMNSLKLKLLTTALDAYDLRAKIGEAAPDPNVAFAHLRRGEVYSWLGRPEAAREQFLKALAVAESLAASNSENAAVRRALAVSYRKMASVSAPRGGKSTEASEYNRKYLSVAEQWVAAEPQNDQAKRELAIACQNMGIMRRQDDPAAARAYLVTFLNLCEELAVANPQNRLAKMELSIAHVHLGELDVQMGDSTSALKHYRKSLELRQELVIADPESTRNRHALAKVYERLGLVSVRRREGKLALDYFDKAVTHFKKLVEAEPRSTIARRDLLSNYRLLADELLKTSDTQGARQIDHKALDLCEAAAANAPNDASSQADVAIAYSHLGTVDIRAKEFGSAAEWFKRAMTILQQLEELRTHKDPERIRKMFFENQRYLATCQATILAGRGQHDEAATTAEKVRQLGPNDPDTLYDTACCFALCATEVAPERPPNQLTAEAAAARGRYVKRALEILKEAVERGYTNVGHMETDPDLNSIREEDAYKRLIEQLKAATRSPKASG